MTQENAVVNEAPRHTAQEIADALRARIREGTLRPGERLPTQAELSEEFGVERGAVRQALRTLQNEGRLVNVSKGSPPRVAEPAHGAEQPQPTMVGLTPRLAEAFASPHVRIDAISLTAQTLMMALGEPVRLIHEGRIRPQSVEVRILLPSRNIDLAFPVSVDHRGRLRQAPGTGRTPDSPGTADDPGGADSPGTAAGPGNPETTDGDPVHERWLQQRNAQGQVLRHNLRALRTSHGVDVHVTFRALPFTPPVKLYLLNGAEALFAYYRVTRRQEEVDDGTVEMWDTLGTESLLFSFEKQAAQRDAAFVQEAQNWFDALWETISSDLTLS